jgi:hypothetical protein
MQLDNKMKSLGVKHKEISLQFFDNRKINIYLHEDIATLCDLHPDTSADSYDKGYEALYFEFGNSDECLMFFKPEATPGDVAHEVKHFINDLFSIINQKLDPNNDELECCMLGTLVDEIWCFIQDNKHTPKSKKR